MNRLSLLLRVLMILCVLETSVSAAGPETLSGSPDASSQWGSGWIELDQAVDLKKGDRLQLQIGGTAKKILVRFLQNLAMADEPVGIEGGIWDVPANRIVEVVLQADYPTVRQISVHGNPAPWKRSLGADNGPATLESVKQIRQ